MGFFKKLFSSAEKNGPPQESRAGKNEQPLQQQPASSEPVLQMPETDDIVIFSAIFTKERFAARFREKDLYEDRATLDGCIKMVEGYLAANKLAPKVTEPLSHPANLDRVIDEGFGFQMYCKALNLGEAETVMFLAYNFSDYLVKTYGFKVYVDSEPDLPLRSMTLKYDKDQVVLSVYPYEYALKALDYNGTFTALDERIKAKLEK